MEFSAAEKQAEAEREVVLRQRVYPRWIRERKISAKEAARRIACMVAIADDYEKQVADQKTSTPAVITPVRDHVILHYAIAPGGRVQWQAPPMGEIVTPNGWILAVRWGHDWPGQAWIRRGEKQEVIFESQSTIRMSYAESDRDRGLGFVGDLTLWDPDDLKEAKWTRSA